jgi:hypothetical protein
MASMNSMFIIVNEPERPDVSFTMTYTEGDGWYVVPNGYGMTQTSGTFPALTTGKKKGGKRGC